MKKSALSGKNCIGSKATKKERSSNIELLRIFAMMGVIFLHYNDGRAFTYVQAGSANQFLLYVLEGICISAVDLFVLINGYYMCMSYRRNLWKIIELIAELMMINEAKYLLSVIVGDAEISWGGVMQSLLPVNYFVMLYAALYIVSPFINIILNKLTNRGLAIFMLSLTGVFSVYPTAVDILRQVTGSDLYGLSTISRTGSQAGFTVVNFIMMYCIGAFLRLYPIKKLTLWKKTDCNIVKHGSYNRMGFADACIGRLWTSQCVVILQSFSCSGRCPDVWTFP